MAAAVEVGDLVACASPSLRAELGLGLDVGLYLVDRKRDGLVLFAGLGRQAWVPKDALKTVASDDPRVLPPPAWLVLVHRAMRLLEASDVELQRSEKGD